MRLIRSLCIAFSMYSRIPVPCGEWDKEDMKYSIGLFPLVGAVIGGLSAVWLLWTQKLMDAAGAPVGTGELVPSRTALFIVRTLIACILPVVVTGGIHVDGFMDTSDAIRSWGDRAKKLQILSDPHIGAFAVIDLMVLAALWVSGVSVVTASGSFKYYGIFGLEFVLARVLSGLAAVLFQNARGEGTLWAFTDYSESTRRINLQILGVLGVLAAAGMVLFQPLGGGAAVIASLVVFGLYRRSAYRDFGGITGDLEGWFLCRCEVAAVCAAAAVYICKWRGAL